MQVGFGDAFSRLEKFSSGKEKITRSNINLVNEIFDQYSDSFTQENVDMLDQLENRVKEGWISNNDKREMIDKITTVKESIITDSSIFDKLSPEVALHIGGFLTGQDHLALRQVNKQFRQTFHTPEAVQAYFDERVERMGKKELFAFVEDFGSSLQHLSLRDSRLSLKEFREIVSFCPNLRDLDVPMYIEDGDVEFLVNKCKNLESLQLAFCDELGPSAIKSLAKLKSLKSLGLRYCESLTEDSLKDIEKFTKLEHLDLSHCNWFRAKGLKSISKLKSLVSLDLSECNVTNKDGAGLKDINGLNLEILKLARCIGVTDEEVRNLKKLKHLIHLDLKETLISGMGLKGFKAPLRMLELENCRINKEGLKQIGQLKLLQFLYLDGCYGVNSKGLEDLEGLAELYHLSVAHCSTIDDKSIEILKKLPSLRVIQVAGTNLSKDGASELEELGISVNP